MAWFWDHYVPDATKRADPRAAPIRARYLGGLPPTIIQTAENDPLRDVGEEFGAKLSEAGNLVDVQRRASLIHGYAGFLAMVPAAADAMQDIAHAIKAKLYASRTRAS